MQMDNPEFKIGEVLAILIPLPNVTAEARLSRI